MKNALVRMMRDDEGQDLVEYALLVAGISLACVLAVQGFGGSLSAWFGGLAARIPLT